MKNKEISIENAAKLLKDSDSVFIELFKHGTLSVEYYKPEIKDYQNPHERDEIYVIVSGSGTFLNGDKQWKFKAGDFLFVPAYTEHRFIDFTDDFSTWVFFYGPIGGENIL